MSYTIAEEVHLPSNGSVYKNVQVNPDFKLRSMTTQEEMIRLAQTQRPYKSLCDIIDACIVGGNPGISSYDMCLGDYHYLLNKLRIVTYGNNYKITSACPYCGAINTHTVDLESMRLLAFDESLVDNLEVSLPITKKIVKLKLQTPRDIDDITIKKSDIVKDNAIESDPTILLTLLAIVESVDGQVLDKMKLDAWIRSLPMRDVNKMLNAIKKINDKIGYDFTLVFNCKNSECGLTYTSSFRINNEFFGPTDDE